MSDLIDREYAIKRFGEDGTYLERHGVAMMTLCEAKQRAVDLIESLPSAHPQSTMGQVNDTVQSTKDCISRQAAIDALSMMQGIVAENGVRKGISMAWQQIADLPSAQPERKKGRWCEHYSHEDGERDGVQCSECGTHYYFGGQLMNFCPNCGADMRGKEDE